MIKVLFLIFSVAVLSACGSRKARYEADVAALRDSVHMLEQHIVALNNELDSYRNSPAKLLARMQHNYEKNQYDSINHIYNLLVKYHPESKAAHDAKIILDKVETERARVAAAQKAAEERAKQERMKAVTKLKKEYDDVSGITWYYQRYFTHYNNTNRTSIYIGQNISTWLRLKMSYYGSDWIFFDHAYLSYDGTTIEIPFNEYRDKETDNTDMVWEWIDVPVSDELLGHLRAMCNAKSVKMRLSGKYTNTRVLSKQEINGIKDILLAYDVLENGI